MTKKIRTGQNLLKTARGLFADGLYAECISLLSSENSPVEDIHHMNLLVKALISQKEFDKAEHYHNVATLIDPNNEDVIWNDIRLKIMSEKYQEARMQAEQTLNVYPKNFDGRLLYANCLRRLGEVEECLSQVKIILTYEPNHPEAIAQLGVLELMEGNKISALNRFRTVFTIKPQLRSIWPLLVNLAVELNDIKGAVSSLNQIMKQETNTKLWIKQFFECLDKLKDPLEAIDALLEVKKYHPHDFNITFALALEFKKLNQKDKVKRYLYEALKIDNHSADLMQEIALIELQEDQVDDAIRHFERALSLRADFPRALNNLGNAYGVKHDMHNALKYYEAAIKCDPKYAQAYNNIGLTYLDRNFSKQNTKKAIENFEFAISLNPSISAYHSNLGIAFATNSLWEEAKNSYTRAINLNPKIAETHNNLGNTLREIGNVEEAEKAYKKSLELDTRSLNAAYNLATLFYEQNDFNQMQKYLSVVEALPFQGQESLYKKFPNDILTARYKEYGSYTKSTKFHKTLPLNLPLIIEQPVDVNFVTTIEDLQSRTLDGTTDTRYGQGYCSTDFQFFRTDNGIIQNFADSFIARIEKEMKSKIVFHESFFNVLAASGGTTPHSHLSHQDKDFHIGWQKYSLVYYLRVGDQTCSEPGILKLYDPDCEILPYEGMCIIMPASQMHSAIYNGAKKRILVGCNFYIV